MAENDFNQGMLDLSAEMRGKIFALELVIMALVRELTAKKDFDAKALADSLTQTKETLLTNSPVAPFLAKGLRETIEQFSAVFHVTEGKSTDE